MSGPLSHFPSQIIIQALIDAGDAVVRDGVSDWQGSSGIMPDNETYNTDNAITVYDTEPILEGVDMNNGDTQLHYGIAVLVRSATNNEAAGQAKIMDIATTTFDRAIKNTSVTIDSSTYNVAAVNRISGPFVLEGTTDNSRRRKYSLNVTASIRQES